MKIVAFLILLLVSSSGFSQSQIWECRLPLDAVASTEPLIALTLDSNSETGNVSVAGTGVAYEARYELRGFDRWWTFGPDDAYGFAIQPDRVGAYYVLNGQNESLSPRQVYACLTTEEADQQRQEQARLAREREVAAEFAQQRTVERERPERRQQAETETRRQSLLQLELARALVAEDERRRAEEAGLFEQYLRSIQRHVERNWTAPKSARPGLECVVKITQVPTGHVVGVEFGRCNGSRAVKREIEAVVRAASPLPRPPVPSMFNRNIEVMFRPEI